MQAESVKSGFVPGEWQTELVNYDGDGEVYVTIFSGPDAELRAKEYCFQTITSDSSSPSPEQQFFAGTSIEELARAQNVAPLKDPGVLSGGIPEDEDVEDLLREIYNARR
jgi:hypothetical protein